MVQGLRDLAGATNSHAALLSALIARVGAIRVPTAAELAAQLGATGSHPINPPTIPGGGSGTGNSATFFGSHAQRLAFSLSGKTLPLLFIETDRYALYEATDTTAPWFFLGNVLGPMTGTVLSPDHRPTDLGAQDAGFIFEGSDANGAWWQWSGSAWVFVIGTGVPIEVTLSPNTKPTLGIHDVGFPVWATDYHRFYLWSGVAWTEGEHNDSRYQIGFFNSPPDQQGWFVCNGGVVSSSTTTGGTTPYTTPNLIGASAFLQSAAAAGGTGGAASHLHVVDPPNTTSTAPSNNTTTGPSPTSTGVPNVSDTGGPSATVMVDNNLLGSTVAVATDTHFHDMSGHSHDMSSHTHGMQNHTHDVDIAPFNSATASNIPPFYNAIPYIRL